MSLTHSHTCACPRCSCLSQQPMVMSGTPAASGMQLKQELCEYLKHDIAVCRKRGTVSGFVEAYMKEMKWEKVETGAPAVLNAFSMHTNHLKEKPSGKTVCFTRATNGYLVTLLFSQHPDGPISNDDFDAEEEESSSKSTTHSFTISLHPQSRQTNAEAFMVFGCYTSSESPSLDIESLSIQPAASSDAMTFWDSIPLETQTKLVEFLEALGIDGRVAGFVTEMATLERLNAHGANLESFQNFFSSYTWHETNK